MSFNRGVVQSESRAQTEDSKFQIVHEKISNLEQNLKRTQESEMKLEQALNVMANKYQNIETLSKGRN